MLEERPARPVHRVAGGQADLKNALRADLENALRADLENALRVLRLAREGRHAGIRLRASRIGADDAERAARRNFLVSGTGGQDDDVTRPGGHLDAAVAAELHRHLALVDA